MKSFEIDLCFKGTREYIQGTDMLNATTAFLRQEIKGNFEKIVFLIHRMTDQNLVLGVCPDRGISELQPKEVAVLKFTVGGLAWEARLAETGVRPICRYPYDEDVVTKLCSFDLNARLAVLQHEAPVSDIETLVALTKAIHHKVFPDQVGRWVFCRLDSPKWPFEGSLKGVCVQLIQNLGIRLTRTEISRDGNILGHIYFSARNVG